MNLQVAVTQRRFEYFGLFSMELLQEYCVYGCSSKYCRAQEKIEDAVREIGTTLSQTVFANLLKKVSSCLANEGGDFEHLL